MLSSNCKNEYLSSTSHKWILSSKTNSTTFMFHIPQLASSELSEQSTWSSHTYSAGIQVPSLHVNSVRGQVGGGGRTVEI